MKRSAAAIAAVFVCSLGAGAASPAGPGTLRNGGFERVVEGSDRPLDWQGVFPRNVPQRPSFSADSRVKRTGRRSGRIHCPVKWGYVSYTQAIPVPAGAKTAVIRGAVRTDLSEGSASLLMLVVDAGGRELAITPLRGGGLGGRSDWTARAVHLALPGGSARLIVRAGVHGKGTAWFDDVELSFHDKLVPPAETLVVHVEARGAYRAQAPAGADDPGAALSIPWAFEGQVPVAYGVSSQPPGGIRQWRVRRDGDNAFLELRLKPMKPGESLKLRWRARLLLRQRPEAFGLAARPIALHQQAPAAVKEFLLPAAGVQTGSEEVKAAAAAVKPQPPEDFRAVMAALSGMLGERLKFAGGGNQGAAEVLRSGKAVCTGMANTACAVLRARGVPTRILACVLTGSTAQEHYITESHVPGHGWLRYESTERVFPVPDTAHVILRVVRPGHPRSPLNVPLYWTGSGGLAVNADMAFGRGDCWHASKVLGEAAAAPARVEEAFGRLRAFWLAQAGRPQTGAGVSGEPRVRELLGGLLAPEQ